MLASRSRMAQSGVQLLVVAGFLFLASAAGATSMGPATTAKLNKAFSAAFATTEAPGAMASVSIGNRTWTAARGSSRIERDVRPRLVGHTRIGSVTKTFTGTLILQLVDRGRLRLDDTIEPWFPNLKDADQITIRDLGTMSSGINTYSAAGDVVDRYLTYPNTVWKPSELIQGGLALPRKFPVGDGFFYSNTNFLMLGKIVQKVTGQPISRVMQRRIFAPLKMKNTSYPSTNRMPAPFWNGYTDQAVTGNPIRNATLWSPTFAGAAGQIISTIGDLRRYTKALGTGSLISRATQRQRLQPNPASVAGSRRYDFAIGFDTGWLSHSGEIPGFNTQIAYLPKRKATIVVFANADIAGADGNPAPTIFRALTKVVAPDNVPAG
jgi:D-alanyl-D-alanine carboxypeptidase